MICYNTGELIREKAFKNQSRPNAPEPKLLGTFT